MPASNANKETWNDQTGRTKATKFSVSLSANEATVKETKWQKHLWSAMKTDSLLSRSCVSVN